ncbi:MAG TPA: ATP-dependent protease ATPase subunit HslU, partial [Dehalococcoidia bacterium]|nr:ATP-dependent protease ATPase subunit HslU [Dehalococcoidia bacterium]
MKGLTPQAVVRELDRYIVGQEEAKRAVAIALRNRERRRHLPPEMRKEIIPKNILMIGPTGVGKTEIARRVVSLIDAPFIKVEATKFTEVGYVGRDVESMVTDLVETAVMKVYENEMAEVTTKAEKLANEKLLDYLCKQLPAQIALPQGQLTLPLDERTVLRRRPTRRSSRQYVAKLLHAKQLEEQIVEIEIGGDVESPAELALRAPEDNWEWENLKEYDGQRRWRRVPVKEARRILTKEEANKLIDFDQVVDRALTRTHEDGVIFIDELDKLCGPKIEVGRDVSGEGVQRDLLPIVEGTTVMTRFGPVKTDYILFIAAGAFYDSKPSDLIPELQGRLPLRVELKALSPQDLER